MRTIILKYHNNLHPNTQVQRIYKDHHEKYDNGVNDKNHLLNKKEDKDLIGNNVDRYRRYKSIFQEFRGKK